MVFDDYLQREDMDLPHEMQKLLSKPITDLGHGFEALEEIDLLINYYISLKIEVSICLLNVFDIIEILTLPTMVPSQKSEWAWHCYNRYFKTYLKILKAAKSNYVNNIEEIDGHYQLLESIYSYEWKKRRSVLEKGGLHNIRATIKEINSILD